MPGCAVIVLLALVLLVVAPEVGGQLPAGFLIGLIAGLLIALLGIFNMGWNAHVDHVESRDHARARESAERDRR